MGNITNIDAAFDILIEQLSKTTQFHIFRYGESNWEKNKLVEITTNSLTPYLALQIEIDGNDYTASEFMGTVKGISFWSEEYDETKISFDQIPEWYGKKVLLRFNLQADARLDALQKMINEVNKDNVDLPPENELPQLASMPDGVIALIM